MNRLHVVVPAGIDDPARPSGGNVYDRRVVAELRSAGRDVRVHRLEDTLAVVLARIPGGSTVLVDGLVASHAAEALAGEAGRLRIAVLLHMPFAEADPRLLESEARAVRAAAVVVTPSRWARAWVVDRHDVDPDRVVVAEPGTDRGPLVAGTPSGGHLLCVAAVTPTKGHDVLVAALARLADLDWTCTCVGALDIDPRFVDEVRSAARAAGIADRLVLHGPVVGPRLDELRRTADLAVSAARHEAFGMSLTEALGRGIPVVATDVGGAREAIGQAPGGTVPGLLAPAENPGALADLLRGWLTETGLRTRLRRSATGRRDGLTSWRETARRVAAALDGAPPLNRTGPGPVVTTDHTA